MSEGAGGVDVPKALFYLLTHDSLHAGSEFLKRFALLNEFEDRSQQSLRDLHLVHSPHSFHKRFPSALRLLLYTINVYLSIEKVK